MTDDQAELEARYRQRFGIPDGVGTILSGRGRSDEEAAEELRPDYICCARVGCTAAEWNALVDAGDAPQPVQEVPRRLWRWGDVCAAFPPRRVALQSDEQPQLRVID